MIFRLLDWTITVAVVALAVGVLWHWIDVARDVYVARYGRT